MLTEVIRGYILFIQSIEDVIRREVQQGDNTLLVYSGDNPQPIAQIPLKHKVYTTADLFEELYR